MSNTLNELSIPRETMVVDYVAGRLSTAAAQHFEERMKTDLELQSAVEFERLLVQTSDSLVAESSGLKAGNNFDVLLSRIEQQGHSEHGDTDFNETKPKIDAESDSSLIFFPSRLTQALPIAASFAALGIALTLLLKPIGASLLAPEFVTLSSDTPSLLESVNLKSLSAESRVAKIVLAGSLDNAAINNMLAAYQLQLISNVPEQSSLIILADTAMDLSRLEGIANDERVKTISLIELVE